MDQGSVGNDEDVGNRNCRKSEFRTTPGMDELLFRVPFMLEIIRNFKLI